MLEFLPIAQIPEQTISTADLAKLLVIMAGGVILFVTVVFLWFKRFGRALTEREKQKAIRMDESGERPSIDR